MELNSFPPTPSTDLQTNTEVTGLITATEVPSMVVPLVATVTGQVVGRGGVKTDTRNLARFSLSY